MVFVSVAMVRFVVKLLTAVTSRFATLKVLIRGSNRCGEFGLSCAACFMRVTPPHLVRSIQVFLGRTQYAKGQYAVRNYSVKSYAALKNN